MPKQEKEELVSKLKEIFLKSRITIFADFRGVSASEMNRLRERLKEQESNLKVVRNTLARIALDLLGKREGIRFLVGPTALIFSYKDEIAPSKVVDEYKDRISIKGALLNGRVLSPDEVLALAKLPPREVLLGQLVGAMKSPLNLLVFSLSSLLLRLIMVLRERERLLSGGGHGTD